MKGKQKKIFFFKLNFKFYGKMYKMAENKCNQLHTNSCILQTKIDGMLKFISLTVQCIVEND